ncbi:Urease accessory protein ureE [Crinalium epipsammum PCC 9333]|uniref:Urease accessory protein UreE n=1 Tax=Crinalium epipsammum PCC 9333 TaxID=1173022 RepID=K9W0S8_9CYAN|nr:urease accessory protein UreE [Crinalium epipsammum]AFZ13399.1 Urease accessory protein ureE [Crinalium epipsammum PCC 9333]
MLTLTTRLPANHHAIVSLTLSLTAEERARSRYRVVADNGEDVYLYLPRGTVLYDGDLLKSETDTNLVRVIAKPEPVFTVTAKNSLDLLKAAYHLGNRHIALEINTTYLRLAPDYVLKTMLEHLNLQVTEEIVPFQPESGAYGHN